MAVYMIFKYSKRFRFAPSFNKNFEETFVSLSVHKSIVKFPQLLNKQIKLKAVNQTNQTCYLFIFNAGSLFDLLTHFWIFS